MSSRKRKKIIRLLGVGFDAEDGHLRLTKGENYDVLMGSDESHEYLQRLIQNIEAELLEQHLGLDDLTPEQFSDLVRKLK
jgi:hypothetical protein